MESSHGYHHPFVLEGRTPNPRGIRELGWPAPCRHPEGVLLYWELLEGTGARRMLISGCAIVSQPTSCEHPAQPRSPPGPLSRVIGCISGWCRPLIRRNSSGAGCNEALPGLSQDRDDRGGISMQAAGFPCGGWIRVWVVIYFFLPSHVLSAQILILTANC